ncbi:MAG TPA: SWIM zinc finger family protein [Verrucomicrobiae bacterium]|nr:SWIM zinc finger family protein [Verrucomicrobiae bacterium]
MAKASAFKTVLTHDALRQLAGARFFERGEDYFASGQVISLVEHGGKLTATVQGSEDYRVRLSIRDGALDYDCSCPMGADGAFCKHCVAAGLAWLADAHRESSTLKTETNDTPVVTLDDARAWLAQQDKAKLVEMLLDQAALDTHLRERLLLEAAKAAGQGARVATIRKAMDRATRTGGFVDYRAARDFSRGIDQVVDSIADLLKSGHAAEVIELAEHALGKVEQATTSMDDSDGYMGGILQQLQELHLEACRKAKPDPEALAERLFDWEMRTHFDIFHGAAGTYSELLGKSGLAAYRRRAEAAWSRLPQTRPGEKDPEEYGRTYRLKHVMETLARQSGDVEALVAIKARDLSNAYTFLQIAEIYREAKQADKALEWAERGVKAFPDRTDSRLCEFLADEYHRRKRHDEAMQIIWKIFAERPSLETCQTLKQHAVRLNQWTAWRDKALELIRAGIDDEKKQFTQKRQPWGWDPHPPDHSLLVEVFLWEKDVEAAWREAQAGGCHGGLWMELARRREKQFPADVIPIYQKQVDALINQKNNGSYAEAAKLLAKIRDLMTRLKRVDEFAAYLATVRATHKPKRNFIKLAAGL